MGDASRYWQFVRRPRRVKSAGETPNMFLKITDGQSEER